jgi:hypothetical protein
MDSWQWMEILRECPTRAVECPCWDEFTPMEWMMILEVHPHFADQCPWEEFDGYCWSTLLRAQPQFADKCSWDELDGAYWWWLLDKQPQFAQYCNIEKLGWDDCEKLLELTSPVDNATKLKIAERRKQFKYRLGFLDGYSLPRKISQCGKCRILITDAIHQCLYYPDGSPNVLTDDYWMNRVNCPHRTDCRLSTPEELRRFAIKYARIFQGNPTIINCSEFSEELLLHGFKIDRKMLFYNCKRIYEETDIGFITSIIVMQWYREKDHDFKWFASALLHLAKIASIYKDKEVSDE